MYSQIKGFFSKYKIFFLILMIFPSFGFGAQPPVKLSHLNKLNSYIDLPDRPTLPTLMECDSAYYMQCIAMGTSEFSFEKCDGFSCAFPIGYYTTDRGEIWRKSSIELRREGPDTYQSFKAIECDDTGLRCLAVGSGTVEYRYDAWPLTNVTNDGGKTWHLSRGQAEPFPRSKQDFTVDSLNAVHCDNQLLNCVMVGDGALKYENPRPISYISGDGGNIWKLSAKLPPKKGKFITLTNVRCDFNKKECEAWGYYAKDRDDPEHTEINYISNDLGNTWKIKS